MLLLRWWRASIVVSQDVLEGDEADRGTYREFADHLKVTTIGYVFTT